MPIFICNDEAISTGIFKHGNLMVQLGSTSYIVYCSDLLVEDDRIWGGDYLVPNTYCNVTKTEL